MKDIQLATTGTRSGLQTTQDINTGFTSLQGNIAGVLSKSVAGSADVTLTADESYNGILIFTGAITADIDVIVPTAAMRWGAIRNDTTGGYTLTVRPAAGTGVVVNQTDSIAAYCDGTNVVQTSDPAKNISAAAAKATPIDADSVGILDSVTGLLKELTFANLAAWFAAVTATLTNKTVNLTSNTLTGTMAQFDAACSDGNLAYSGTAASFSSLTVGSATVANPFQIAVTPNANAKTSGSAFDGAAMRIDGNLQNVGDQVALLFGANDGLSCGIGAVRESGGSWGTSLVFYNHVPGVTTTDELTAPMTLNSSGTLLVTGAMVAPGSYSTTTASAANMFVDTDGSFKRSTSTAALKTDIEDMEPAVALNLVNLFRAVWYRSLCAGDNPDWSWYGAIAEEVAAIDPRFVHFGYVDADYEIVTVDDGMVEEQIIDTVLVDKPVVEIVNGIPVLVVKQVETKVPRVDHVQLVDAAGAPVLDDKDQPRTYPVPVMQMVAKSHPEKRLKATAVASPIGLQYERFTAPLMLVAKLHGEEIAAMKLRLDALEAA